MYKNLQDAMKGLSIWKDHRRNKVEPLVKNIAYRPTFNTDTYREAAFHRFIDLAESSFHLYKSNFLLGAVVTARSAQETLAALWYINSKLEGLVRTKNLRQFLLRMKRLMLGWSEDQEFPEKINALDLIDSVDKVLKGDFRSLYDILSEYAHPNYSGTLGAYSQANHKTLEVAIGIKEESQKIMSTHVESTLIVCITLLNDIQEKYDELINQALDVCFELHKNGELSDIFYDET